MTSGIVTRGLNTAIPIVLYNGAMILDLKTQKILDSATENAVPELKRIATGVIGSML